MPRSALLLGLAGLLPFLGNAAVILLDRPELLGSSGGARGLEIYGIVILCFMSGVLWGFATKADDGAALWYSLSVIPALWVFFGMTFRSQDTLGVLLVGFIGLLALDYTFQRAKLAPDWWIRLRVLLTTIVSLCLAIGIMT